MQPPSLKELIEILTPNLINVAPSGMSKDQQVIWYKAAALRISEKAIPKDLLEAAAVECFFKADHPAKIMKIIWDEIKEEVQRRQKRIRELRAAIESESGNRPRLALVEASDDDRAAITQSLGELTRDLTRRAKAERQAL